MHLPFAGACHLETAEFRSRPGSSGSRGIWIGHSLCHDESARTFRLRNLLDDQLCQLFDVSVNGDRFSLGRFTTEKEIDETVRRVTAAVQSLRVC